MISVRPLTENDVPAFLGHYDRHCAESGADGDIHFLPADSVEIVTGKFNHEAFRRRLDEPEWRRWFVATANDTVVGHADLKGGSLRSGLHRCQMGIGVERRYRGQGIGRSLVSEAIDFAIGATSVEWVDLHVHAHNSVALRLYESVGFRRVGLVSDRFRIGSERIDDVLMTLNVRLTADPRVVS